MIEKCLEIECQPTKIGYFTNGLKVTVLVTTAKIFRNWNPSNYGCEISASLIELVKLRTGDLHKEK